MKRGWLLAVVVCVLAFPKAVRADYLIYTLDDFAFLLKGNVTVNPGKTVSFVHPRFGNLYFRLEDVKHIKAPTTQEEYNRALGKAKATKDANQIFEAGVGGMKKGLLKEFYACVDATLQLDPKHERALKVKSLRERISVPLPDTGKEEEHVRNAVKRKEMKIAKSAHFVLLHDTSDKPRENHKKPRAQERLELLEQVYESFLLTFYSQGVELTIPDYRLEVVLFDKYDDFRVHSGIEDSPGVMTSGYWDPRSNVAFFFDNSSTPRSQAIGRMVTRLDQDAKDLVRAKAKDAGQIVRFANTLKLLVHVDNENDDISVVSHECTHQMAGNTGLLPRTVGIPGWVHEGLATYFESPADASWSGIGAVNKERLGLYRAMEPISQLELVINDRLFLSGQGFTMVHGYSQAWALTHFLLETRFEKMMKFYQLLGEMPRELDLFPETLTKLFKHVFQEDMKALDTEWKAYMRKMKSDVEVALDKL